MRKYLVLLVIIITFFSCKVQEANTKSFIGQTDYSASAKVAIELIKEKMLAGNILEFSVEIESNYRGVFYSTMTHFKKDSNKVILSTVFTDVLGDKSQSIKTYSIEKINKRLNRLIKKADKQKKSEHVYQEIRIEDNGKSSIFYTRKASGLIDLIE